ncbi:MAG TPA: tetratricopeptide repeat protein [Terriglobales bacterium]|nr:tetratricopeptide repeat protein [Terriglobales bacterium]
MRLAKVNRKVIPPATPESYENIKVTLYARTDVLRILRIQNRQIQSWEKAGLLSVADSYSFFDLLQIKKLRDLCAKRVRSAVIRKSLEEMRLAAGMTNPLLESSVFSTGNRVAFRHQGKAMEPIAGQFVMDFAGKPETMMVSTHPNVRNIRTGETALELFARGVALEEDPATHPEAIRIYKQVLELEPMHAAAHINLGTLFYNQHDFVQAEASYRSAIAADSRYALAYFDLGNVLDETGRLEDAVRAYKTAILIAPTYADAHYNLALAFEKLKQPRRALHHWQVYIKLDTTGPWSVHARAQVSKILTHETLAIVARRGRK